MTKEFVTYEQAVALEQLGIDVSCFGWYSDSKGLFQSSNPPKVKGVVKAPLKQQALKWFEEEHCLFCNFATAASVNEILGTTCEIVSWKCIPIPVGTFATRDEAIHTCINKLISILKQN